MTPKLLQKFLPEPLVAAFPGVMPELVSPRPNDAIGRLIPAAETALLQALPAASAHSRNCLRAGLWLLAGEMDRAHKFCQDVPTGLGSAWHAHLHRREPDFFNSMYWWRRAAGVSWTLLDRSPIHFELAATLRGVAASLQGVAGSLPDALASRRRTWLEKLERGYDPAELVAAVEQACDLDDPPEAWIEALREAQRLEWAALFAESVRAAGG